MFADDTTVMGLVKDGDESAYRNQARSEDNNRNPNPNKTKEMIIDFRRSKPPHGSVMHRRSAYRDCGQVKFLGNAISNELSWKVKTNAIVSKAHQRLYFLKQLKKFGLKKKMLIRFYRSTIASVLPFSICLWFGGLSAHRQHHLDRVVKTAERIIGCSLPPLGTIYRGRCLAHARKVISDSQHPAYHLFERLPSGRRFRSIKAKWARFSQSMYPRAEVLLNPQ